MKNPKKLVMACSVIVMLFALAKYWMGGILDALFWMSVASALLIIGTEIKE